MPHPVDIHVGKTIRHRRGEVGMIQQQLAELIGIKFQQVQKYETGANRVSASRLWDISVALDVPIYYFFEGCEETAPGEPPLDSRETDDLIRSVHSMTDEQRRRLDTLLRDQINAA